ncbi:MAG: ATP-binding protein, partial [Bacteroidetes bacterium]|nr:ATP-binding protein [Bacteroidota bacterium]
IDNEHILFINKELLEFDAIKTFIHLHQFVNAKIKGAQERFYLFVDEIQEIDQWERAIASLLAEKRTDIYISGSNARLLSSELASLLSGRYIEIKMYTFCFQEFKQKFKNSRLRSGNDPAFDTFIKYGGFPGLHSMDWEDVTVRQFLESIYNTIVLKDIVIRYSVHDVYMLEKIIEFLISNCGSITSANRISSFLKSQNKKVSVETALNYINYTRNALLMNQIKRYDLKGKRILETLEKYYVCDIGLRYALLGFSPEILPGNLENIVLLEMLSRGYKVFLGKMNDLEVDFVAEKANERMYLQVCTSLKESSTVDREYRSLEKIDDHFPKMVLSLDSGFETSRKGIKWMNIRDFLQQQ